MPINRAPFNALVDDDGSNTIGSPWNKAAIAGVLLDPTDAYVGGGLVVVPFNAADFTANNGATWALTSANFWYQLVAGKLMAVYLNWGAGVVTGAPSNLNIKIPGGRVAAATTTGVSYVSAPAFEVGAAIVASGQSQILLHRPGIAAFPAGSNTGYVGIVFPVQ